jgi:hypothetical protein
MRAVWSSGYLTDQKAKVLFSDLLAKIKALRGGTAVRSLRPGFHTAGQ